MSSRVQRAVAALIMGAFLATTLAPVTAGAGQPSTPSPTAFACDPGFYQVLSGQLTILNPVTDAYTNIGSQYPSPYNAMGYNVLDNYVYAIRSGGTPHLLKIGSNGAVADQGALVGITGSQSGLVAGDMDNQGNLIVNWTSSKLAVINIATRAGTLVNLTNANTGLATNFPGYDLVWIGGVLYGLNNHTLFSINEQTGAVTTRNVTGLSTMGNGGTFGSGYSDSTHDLFFADNTSGNIVKIAGYTGASPSATLIGTGAPTTSNDGASCDLATSPFQAPTTSDSSYATTLNTALNVTVGSGVLANASGFGLSASVVSQPAHGTLSLNTDGSFTYQPALGFTGTDSFTFKALDSSGRTTNTSTATITVSTGTLYPVSYVANGASGTVPTQASLPTGQSFTVGSPTLLVDAGSHFTGWSDGTSTYQPGDTYTISSSNVTLTAQWATNGTDTISYNAQGGSAVSATTGPDGSSVNVADGPTQAGFTFTGWNTSADGTGTSYAAGDSLTLTGDLTLYAQWTAIRIDTISYNSQGGSSVTPTTGFDGASVSLADGPSLAGYTFAGWNTSADGTGTSYAAGDSSTLTGDLTLYAQWTANRTDTVTYNSEGGTAVSSGSGLDGTSIAVAGGPTLAGYTFAGWNTSADGTGTSYAAGDSLTLTGDLTLYAQWTANATITLSYDAQGGSVVPSVSFLQGTTILVASAPVRVGFVFSGWNTAANGSGTSYGADATYLVSGEATLYAQWAPAAYGGTFACSTGILQVADGQLGFNNLATGSFSTVGSAALPSINAIGYNEADNFLYGIRTRYGRPHIVRIGADGTVTTLGVPTGVSFPRFSTFYAGDMDGSGNLVVRVTSTNLAIINVTTLTTSLVTLSSPAFGNDVVWIDGMLYSLGSHRLYRINESTGQVTSTKVSGLNGVASDGTYGAGWTDSAGDLFFQANTTGKVIQVTPSGQGASAVVLSTSVVSKANDGTSCRHAWNPTVMPVTSNRTYGTPQNSTLNVTAADGVLSGAAGAGLVASVASAPLHGTVSVHSDGSFTFQPAAGFVGTTTFTFSAVDAWGNIAATSTVTLTVG